MPNLDNIFSRIKEESNVSPNIAGLSPAAFVDHDLHLPNESPEEHGITALDIVSPDKNRSIKPAAQNKHIKPATSFQAEESNWRGFTFFINTTCV
jgi:hypothetical protein